MGRWLLVAGVLGCAKSPPGISGAGVTRVIFTIRFDDRIDPTLYYDVAIRATSELNPPPQLAPIPVVADGGSPNYRMAGSPTHFVEFNNLDPYSAQPFLLYRFKTQLESPNPSDSQNPINLAQYPLVLDRPIINFTPYEQGTSELHFEITTDQLADNADAAKALNTLQVQILTMSRLANGTPGTRTVDYLGPRGNPEFVNIDLRASRIYSNANSGGVLETNGDCEQPSLDIKDWSVEVRRP